VTTTVANPVVDKGASSGAEANKNPAAPAALDKRKALGRGLESLLPGGSRAGVPAPPSAGQGPVAGEGARATQSPQDIQAMAERRKNFGDEVLELRLDQVDENPYQTRKLFDPELMQELAHSIRTQGVVQPIVVRPAENGRYVLIIGERRCRASKLAGRETIPAIVRRVSDQQAAEMTVIENLQRQDLNCLEQAAAFGKLSQKFRLTQQSIGYRFGLSRESVSNYMRLLKLPIPVIEYLKEGVLGFSEARELLKLDDEKTIERIAEEAFQKNWNLAGIIDAVEAETAHQYERLPESAPGRARWVDPNVRAAQRDLERLLGVRVRIRDKKGKGKIVLEYATLEDFDRVMEMLTGQKK
jgi:ParB family chromosome partitioning protein